MDTSLHLSEAEDDSLQREHTYRSIFAAAPIGTATTDLQGRLVESNRALQTMLGYTADELQSMPFATFTHPDDLPRQMILFRELVAGLRASYQIEKRYIRKDGRIVWGRLTESVADDGNGQPHFLIAMVEDITERVAAQEQLREKENQYQSIFESTTDGLVISDLQTGIVLEANPRFCAMHGYTYEEMIGRHPCTFVHPSSSDRLDEYFATVEQGGTYQTGAIDIRKDGTPFHVEVHGSAFQFGGRAAVLGVVRDISERMQAYEMLEQRVTERTRELTTLLDVSRTVASTLELQPLLGLILDQLRMVAEYDGAGIVVREGDELQVIGYRGPIPQDIALQTRFTLEQSGPVWEFLQRRKPVLIEDVRGDSPLARSYQRAVGDELYTTYRYVRTFMVLPLTDKERVIGGLTMERSIPCAFSPQQMTLVKAIAQQAATAIANAQLYQQAQQGAALEERARLARELHDSVTQALFSMTLHVRALHMLLQRAGIDLSGPVGEGVQRLTELTQGALAEMRALIFELRPGALKEEGLLAALRKHAAALSAREDLKIKVDVDAPHLDLPDDVQEELYRLTQEAIHNVVKHARASEVYVQVSTPQENLLTIEISDNGVGFDVTTERPGHMGLSTMAERARRAGGTFHIQSTEGEGTRVRVTVHL